MNLLNITVLPDPHHCTLTDASPPPPVDTLPVALPNNAPLGVRFCKPRACANQVLYNFPLARIRGGTFQPLEQHFLN